MSWKVLPKMSLAIQEMIVCLHLLVCLSYKDFLSCISCVVAMDITSILKHVVEYLRQTAFIPFYMMHKFWDLKMIKFKCKLYSCRNADLILILVVAMTNGFIFIITILGGGGGKLDLAWLKKKTKLMKQLVIHSFYQTKSDSIKILVRKLLNVGSIQQS